MTKSQSAIRVEYKPRIDQTRWPLQGYLNANEHCYTEEELSFRKTMLKIRQSIGFGEQLLEGQMQWFETDEKAFDNVNQGSWFFGARLKPVEQITKNHFHWRYIDTTSAQWDINTIGTDIARYLEIRNKNLAQPHLNDPYNFMLLDVMRIVSKIALNANAADAASSLDKLSEYVRHIKSEIEATEGSDRHFLYDLVNTLSEHKHIIEQLSKNKELTAKLLALKNQIEHLAHLSGTLAHYALNNNELEPYTTHHEHSQLSHAAPAKSLEACAEKSTQLDTYSPFFTINNKVYRVNREVLTHCPTLAFIQGLSDDIKDAYLRVHSDVFDLKQLQQIIDKIIQLTRFGGEYYTALQHEKDIKIFLEKASEFLITVVANFNRLHEINSYLQFQTSQQLQTPGWLPEVKKYLFHSKNTRQHQQFIENSRLLDLHLHDKTPQNVLKDTRGTIESIIFSIDDIVREDASVLEKQYHEVITNLMHDISNFNSHYTRSISGDAELAPIPRLASEPVVASQNETPLSQFARMEQIPSNDMNAQCFAIQTGEFESPQWYCQGKAFSAYVIPKTQQTIRLQLEGIHPTGHTHTEASASGFIDNGDQYDLKSCHSITYRGTPSVVCEGKNSIAVFQLEATACEAFFANTSSNAALAVVLWHMGKNMLSWFANAPESAAVPKMKINKAKIDAFKDQLSMMHALLDETNRIDMDSWEQFHAEVTQAVEGKLSAEAIDHLQQDIDCFFDYLQEDRSTSKQGQFTLQPALSFFTPPNKAEMSRVSACSSQLHLR